jgi:hypothetical protein
MTVYIVYARNNPGAPAFAERLFLTRKHAEAFVADAHPSFREQHLIWIQERVVEDHYP